MSGRQFRQAEFNQDREALKSEDALKGSGSFIDQVDAAVARMASTCASAEAGARYTCGFASGEALALLFRQRCSQSAGPYGLATIIKRMLVVSPESGAADAVGRTALFAGFCWELERALGDSSRSASAMGLNGQEGTNEYQIPRNAREVSSADGNHSPDAKDGSR